MLQLNGHEKYQNTDFGKIMLYMHDLEKKRAIEFLMQQPGVFFTVHNSRTPQ
jgi:hypothetical protein